MYVIVNTSNSNRIIVGPMEWKPKYFSLVLSDEFDQEINVSQSDQQLVPYEVVPGTHIRECDVFYENDLDSALQEYSGPTWTFHANGSATATWGKSEKPLHIIQNEHINLAAKERHSRETTPFKYIKNGVNYTVNTSREDRSIFILLMNYTFMPNNGTVNWRFPEGFVSLTKTEVENLMNLYLNHVQGAFDWEMSKYNEIKNSIDKNFIKSIEIKTKTPFIE